MERDLRRLLIPYALLAMVGAVVSTTLVRPTIISAHAGQSIAILNRVFQGKSRPVDHYLGLWNNLAWAVAIAGGLHLGLLLIVRKHLPGLTRPMGLVCLLFLGLTVLSGVRHDYVADLEMWQMILNGGDPWWFPEGRSYPLNAYGPAFNLLAPLIVINPLLPKLVFATVYLGFLIGVLKDNESNRSAVWALLILNPLAWLEVAYFGHFDVLVGAACVLALRALDRGRAVSSGIWLGLGVLLKYLPVVILPFLAFEGRRIRWRFVAASLATIALGLGASLIFWGPSTFRPLTFAATRGANLLSLFRFLEGRFSPFGSGFSASKWSMPCLVLAGFGVFVWSRIFCRKVSAGEGAVAGLLTTLIFYQVGFVQYQIVLLMVFGYVELQRDSLFLRDRIVQGATALYFGWLAAFDLFYGYVGGIIDPAGPWAFVEDLAGLPTFGFGIGLLASLVVGAIKKPALDQERVLATGSSRLANGDEGRHDGGVGGECV